MTAPTRWTVIEAGEEVSGPIRLLDWQNEREVNYVRKTWARTVKWKPQESRFPLMSDALGKDDFWDVWPIWRDHLMRSCEVRLACSPSGQTILGWACVVPHRSLLHYVFVQQDFRRRGVMKALLADMMSAPAYFSHRTYDWMMLQKDRHVPPSWRFSLLRGVI